MLMSDYRCLITANPLITMLAVNYNFADYLVENTAVYAPITFEEIVIVMINNGNRTEWSPIRSVIIRVINKIGRLQSRSLIC